MIKKIKSAERLEPSKLERELEPVLRDDDGLTQIRSLLAQLYAREKSVIVTSYPACNAGKHDDVVGVE